MNQVIPRRAYIDGPFGQIHLHSAGEGRLPLLLLHQSPLSGAMFAAAMGQLAASGIHAVAMDAPGYGASDPPPQQVSAQGYTSSVMAIIDGLGWDRAAILGHHTGAAIATAFANVYSLTIIQNADLRGYPGSHKE